MKKQDQPRTTEAKPKPPRSMDILVRPSRKNSATLSEEELNKVSGGDTVSKDANRKI